MIYIPCRIFPYAIRMFYGEEGGVVYNTETRQHEIRCLGVYITNWGHLLYWPINKYEFTANVDVVCSLKNLRKFRQNGFRMGYHAADNTSRKMLQNKIATDLVIVAADGTRIDCHKMFLWSKAEIK